MIDVLEKIKDLLIFESDDDFYYLQVLQRKKDNPHIGSNSRVIKNYYITSVEHLLKHYSEIKELCVVFNARASLRLNKRSFEKVGYKAMVNIANTMSNREFRFLKNSYDRACGLSHNDKNKKWILDIDEGDADTNEVLEFLNTIEPLGNKVYKHIPTKNGEHLITKPFNLMEFSKKFPKIDVHKDNPINLFIP